MKTILIGFFLLLTLSLYGCSGDDDVAGTDSNQPVTVEADVASQAETMEEIWASSLEPAEKARRVQELLAQQGN